MKVALFRLEARTAERIKSSIDLDDPEFLVASTAHQIVDERAAKGQKFNGSFTSASKRTDYPRDIWEEAEKRWKALSEDEQTAAMEQWRARIQAVDELIAQQRRNLWTSPDNWAWYFLGAGFAVLTAVWRHRDSPSSA